MLTAIEGKSIIMTTPQWRSRRRSRGHRNSGRIGSNPIPTGQYTDSTLFRRLLRQARPYWPHIVGIFLLGLIATPLMLLGPVPLKIAVDSVVGSSPVPGFLAPLLPGWLTGSSIRLLAMAAGLQVLVVLLTQLQELGVYVLRTRAGEGLTLEFRSSLFRHVQRLSLLFHDSTGPADSLCCARVGEAASST